MPGQFADTNVLLYAISTDPAEADKRAIATDILSDGNLSISVQVLQEFYVQATRVSRPDRLPPDQALGLMESFTRFRIQESTPALALGAARISQQHGLSYWDSAIVEAARVLGRETVLSEDMAHGRQYEGVGVVNPFR